MNQRVDKGFFTHTATARPYWGGDVSVSFGPAPRRNAGVPRAGLRHALARVFAAVTGR
jgi:hypothetical protein